MITDQITIMETIPTQAFGNVKLEIKGTLEPGETELEAWKAAKEKINNAYQALYGQPEMTTKSWLEPIVNTHNSVIDRSIERLEILIDDCKTMFDLINVTEKNPKILENESLLLLHAKKTTELSQNQQIGGTI